MEAGDMEVVYQVSHGWHSCQITVLGRNPEMIAAMIDKFEKAKFPEKYKFLKPKEK